MKVLVVGPTVPKVLADDPSLIIVHAPLIELVLLPVPEEFPPASGTMITSNSVLRFCKRLPEPFYCVGSRSAAAVLEAFPNSRCLTAAVSTQEGLVELICKNRPQTLLWPRSTHARRVLPEALHHAGIDVIEIPLYTPVLRDCPCSLAGVDELFFTCPSAVEAFFGTVHPRDVAHMPIRSIGPVTAACITRCVDEACGC